jgi:hypothetical protein
MSFTNFCCRSGGSNLNAGTLTGNTTEPGTAASFTYASGNWVQSTGVFTVASGDPASDGVAVGDFASVYADGSTVTGFVGRVTARDATTITVSGTAKSGTKPTDGTGDRTLKIGGAWGGPNGTESFPFNFIEETCTNSSDDVVRVNFKNDADYDITTAMSHTKTGPIWFQGYTTSYNDGGKAAVDGGTSGASYVLLTMSGSGVAHTFLRDLIFKNNGATGTANGLDTSGAARTIPIGCVVHDVRGNGFKSQIAVECEAYNCNQSNSTITGGFFAQTTGACFVRCIAHDNTGSNNNGFYTQISDARFVNCIADSNGLNGFLCNNVLTAFFTGCDAYNNGADGIRTLTSPNVIYYDNCNLIKNGGYGINASSGVMHGTAINCGFGAGTQANTSGTIGGTNTVVEIGTVTYPDDKTPWVDPANGDFSITLKQARGTGRGTFTQTASGYSGTVGYPDIGAAQSLNKGAAMYILGIHGKSS